MRISPGKGIRIEIAGLALALALAVPAAAGAAEPLKVREVFPGSTTTDPKAEYVQLQMTADGQGDVEGQELRFYDAAGEPIEAATYELTEGDAEALLADSQRTVLLATPEAVAAAGTLGADLAEPDATLASADGMSPAGGAVCFTGAGGGAPADCVSWGTFATPGSLADPQSANAAEAGVTDGQALRRDITRGCETYLDSPDDTGSSAADFELKSPAPRNNESEPSEIRCPPTVQGLSGPASPSNSSEAELEFGASEEGAEFQCHLDEHPTEQPPGGPANEPSEPEWEAGPCASPEIYPALEDGFYRFWVRAKGENPEWGPASSAGWQIDTNVPQTTIDSTPPSPNSGFSVSFGYSSSEPFSSFDCQLDGGAIQNCGSSASSSSKSYFDLDDGTHTFRVWATDNAGNKDPSAAEHSFEVQTVLGDFTPPDTTILAAPANPSRSSAASFAFVSSEEGSSFECSLNGAPFTACAASGAAYANLPNGPHSFSVRAIDRAGNVDSVPAAHAWTVAASAPSTRFTKAPSGAVRAKGKAARVSFGFAASEPGSSFRCRLDLKGAFKPCNSPHSFRAKAGRHVFEVFAIDRLGNQGASAFRIFRVRARGGRRAFFTQSGRFLSSLSADISPSRLPRKGLRPVTLRFGSTFENLDGSDIPPLRKMTLRLASGGVVDSRGLPRCARGRLAQRSSAQALRACKDALVGEGVVNTAIRFPEGARIRAKSKLLLFNAGKRLLMHIHTTNPVRGTFIVPLEIRKSKGRFGTVLSARFPRIAADFGHVTGFQMKLHRTYRFKGKRRSYLLGGCPIPRAAGLKRLTFELARVEYRFAGGLRIRNSTINSCRAVG